MWTLFRFELRHILRDLKQLIIVAVVIPLLLAPFVNNSLQKVQRQGESVQTSTFFVAITGPKASMLRRLLPTLGRFRELPIHNNPEDGLREGLIDCYIYVDRVQSTGHRPDPSNLS